MLVFATFLLSQILLSWKQILSSHFLWREQSISGDKALANKDLMVTNYIAIFNKHLMKRNYNVTEQDNFSFGLLTQLRPNIWNVPSLLIDKSIKVTEAYCGLPLVSMRFWQAFGSLEELNSTGSCLFDNSFYQKHFIYLFIYFKIAEPRFYPSYLAERSL